MVIGFKLGSGKHTAEVIIGSNGCVKVTSGITDLSLLKTTQVFKDKFLRCFDYRAVLHIAVFLRLDENLQFVNSAVWI